MTRLIIYNCAFLVFIAATLITIASIKSPNWVAYSAGTKDGATFERHIGLHQECTTGADPKCQPYPRPEQCQGNERYFCSMWRTIGFLMSLAVIFELATIVSFIVIVLGGKAKRIRGWPIVVSLLVTVSAVCLCCMAIAAYLFDNDDQFVVPGWRLATAWILCTLSAVISLICAVALSLSAVLLPQEDGYELLDDDNLEDVA